MTSVSLEEAKKKNYVHFRQNWHFALAKWIWIFQWGIQKTSHDDSKILLRLHHEDSSRSLYNYAKEFVEFSGTKVITSMLYKWFFSSFDFKGTYRKPSFFLSKSICWKLLETEKKISILFVTFTIKDSYSQMRSKWKALISTIKKIVNLHWTVLYRLLLPVLIYITFTTWW